MFAPESSTGICCRSSQKPRCAASEPAKYASTRLSSAANSGITWRRGRGTDETRNVVLPARTRIFAFAGIGADRRAALRGELGERRRLAVDDHLAFHAVAEVEREVVAVRRDEREVRRRRLLDRELDAGRRADANVRADSSPCACARAPRCRAMIEPNRPPNAITS